jgi:hypothetical protein
MNFAKPKLYDEDNNEIIPPEGATGFVVGEHCKWEWTYSDNSLTTMIIPYDFKQSAENITPMFKFAPVAKITKDTWYLKLPSKRVRMKLRSK